MSTGKASDRPVRAADQRLAHRLNTLWGPVNVGNVLSDSEPLRLSLPVLGRYATPKAENRLHLDYTALAEERAFAPRVAHERARHGWTLWLFRGDAQGTRTARTMTTNSSPYVLGSGAMSPQDAVDRAIEGLRRDPLNWGREAAAQRLETLIRQALVLVEGEMLRTAARPPNTVVAPVRSHRVRL